MASEYMNSPSKKNDFGYGVPNLEFDLTEAIAFVRQQFWIIAIPVAVIMALAFLYLNVAQYTYMSSASILLDLRERQKVTSIETVVSQLPSEDYVVDTEVEVLRSAVLANRVIDDLDLMNDPEFNYGIEGPPFSLLGLIGGIVSVLTFSGSDDTVFTRDDVIEVFKEKTFVYRQATSYVIVVGFTSFEPEKAARIANALADAYLQDQLQSKFDATQDANEWLSDRLVVLRDEVREAELAVETFRAQNNLLDANGARLNEQQMAEISAQLILAQTKLAEDRARLQKLQALINSGRADSVGEATSSRTITQLRQQQAQIVRQKAELETQYTPRHPSVIRVNRELEDLERQIEAEVGRIVGTLRNELAVSQERVRSLQSNLDAIERQNATSNQALVPLRQLEREAEASRAVYEAFLSRFKETNESRSFQVADARIIERARLPREAASPQALQVMTIALIVSLMIGVSSGYLRHHFSSGFTLPQEVENMLGLPVLTSVPKLGTATSSPEENSYQHVPENYVIARPLSVFAESFRNLQIGLMRGHSAGDAPKTVLFTSSLPGEGKTTSALCFARMAASSGLQTILIDADMRCGNLAEKTGTKPRFGLMELLTEEDWIGEVLVHDSMASLDMIMIARKPENPLGLLTSERMEQLLAHLKTIYDLIVIDSAPILPVADSRALAKQADKVVFVVEWNNTPRKAAASAVSILNGDGTAQFAGVVFNQVDVAKQRRLGEAGIQYSGRYGDYTKG